MYHAFAYLMVKLDIKTLQVVSVGIYSEDSGSITTEMNKYCYAELQRMSDKTFGDAKAAIVEGLRYCVKLVPDYWLTKVEGFAELIKEDDFI